MIEIIHAKVSQDITYSFSFFWFFVLSIICKTTVSLSLAFEEEETKEGRRFREWVSLEMRWASNDTIKKILLLRCVNKII